MRPLRTDQDVLDFASLYGPSRACSRALREGAVRVTARPDEKGWQVDVLSRMGKRWYLFVSVDEETRRYSLRVCNDPACNK